MTGWVQAAGLSVGEKTQAQRVPSATLKAKLLGHWNVPEARPFIGRAGNAWEASNLPTVSVSCHHWQLLLISASPSKGL